jgi:hypothetical protein
MRKRALSQAGLGSSNRASQPSSAELIPQYTVQCTPRTPRPPPGPLFLPISPTSTSFLSSYHVHPTGALLLPGQKHLVSAPSFSPRRTRSTATFSKQLAPAPETSPRVGLLLLSLAAHSALEAAHKGARGGAQRRSRRRTEAAPGGGPGRAAMALGARPRRPSRRRRRRRRAQTFWGPDCFFYFI